MNDYLIIWSKVMLYKLYWWALDTENIIHNLLFKEKN